GHCMLLHARERSAAGCAVVIVGVGGTINGCRVIFSYSVYPSRTSPRHECFPNKGRLRLKEMKEIDELKQLLWFDFCICDANLGLFKRFGLRVMGGTGTEKKPL